MAATVRSKSIEENRMQDSSVEDYGKSQLPRQAFLKQAAGHSLRPQVQISLKWARSQISEFRLMARENLMFRGVECSEIRFDAVSRPKERV
jgi:hypothetical protein